MRVTAIWIFAAAICALSGAGRPAAAQPKTEPYVWRNVEIVAGGFVTGIVFHPKERGLVYARTDMGGAYRWDAKASRWIPLTDWAGADDWNLLGIESLAVDPTDARRVYMAAGTYTNDWAGNGAILHSTDRGRTWRRTDMPFKFGGNEDGRSIGERLAVDPNRPDTLWLGTRHDGLWRSADRGTTWARVESFPVTDDAKGIGVGFVLLDVHSGRRGRATPTLYVGVAAPGTHLYRSRNGGTTWEAVPGQPVGMLPHHGALDRDGALYLTYGSGPGPNGMTDGAVWRLDTKTGAWADITPLRPGEGDRFGYAGLALDAAHPGTLVVATMDRWSRGDDLFRTTDGGRTWTALGPNATRDSSTSPYLNWGAPTAKLGHWIGSVAIDPFDSGRALYVTGATIWGTGNLTDADRGLPTRWVVRGQGVEQTAVLDLASPPAGAHLLSALGDIGGFRHDDLSVSPREGMASNPILTSTRSLDFAASAPEVVARVGSAGNNTRRGAFSTDGGKTWTPFGSEPEGSRGSGSIAVSADGRTFLWSPDGGATAFSRDRGTTWTACAGLPRGVQVVADRANPARFYALDGRSGTLYASADGGAVFAVAAGRLPGESRKLRAAPGREGDLWMAAGKGGLYRSTDEGRTLARRDAVQEAYALGFGMAAPGRDFAAVYLTGKVDGVKGVFRSDDEGATWVRINDDAHQYGWIGQCVIGDPRIYGRVYLATNGRGILYADPIRRR